MATGKEKQSKRKRRIPVPQKPPKVIPGKKIYDRKKVKNNITPKGTTEESDI